MKKELIRPSNTITINIRKSENIKLIYEEAIIAETGGKSQIYTTPEERKKYLKENQLTGQAGNFALHRVIFNDEKMGIEFYKKSRAPFHINPKTSDKGMDIVDSHIDIKNSFSLHKALYDEDNPRKKVNMSTYRLPVRPEEMHPNWIYVSALTEEMNNNLIIVHILGWAKTLDFPKETEQSGEFNGCYTIRNYNIRAFPIPNIFPEYLQPYLRKGLVEDAQ